jgi:hypothetical protein
MPVVLNYLCFRVLLDPGQPRHVFIVRDVTYRVVDQWVNEKPAAHLDRPRAP